MTYSLIENGVSWQFLRPESYVHHREFKSYLYSLFAQEFTYHAISVFIGSWFLELARAGAKCHADDSAAALNQVLVGMPVTFFSLCLPYVGDNPHAVVVQAVDKNWSGFELNRSQLQQYITLGNSTQIIRKLAYRIPDLMANAVSVTL